MTDDSILELVGLSKWFPNRSGLFGRSEYVHVLDKITLSIHRRETFGLVGESGCGKTTLARTATRLIEPSEGSIRFDGEEISKLKGRHLKHVRRKMQMVFQDPYASLDPRQTVRSALIEPMRLHRVVSTNTEAYRLAEELVQKVGLSLSHLQRFPHEFSGGQRQRIAIATTLALNPAFIVLDEPTSSLDVSVQGQILRLLKELQRDLSLTYLFISHNLAVIRQMSDRTGVMFLGRLVELGSTQKVFENPKHPYTKALLSSIPIPDPSKRRQLVPLKGEIGNLVVSTGCHFRSRCPYATEKCATVSPPWVEVEEGHWIECHYDLDLNTSHTTDLLDRAPKTEPLITN